MRQINAATSLTKVGNVNKSYYDFQKGFSNQKGLLKLLHTPETNKFAIYNFPKFWDGKLPTIAAEGVGKCVRKSAEPNATDSRIPHVDFDNSMSITRSDVPAVHAKSSERRVDHHQNTAHLSLDTHNVLTQPRFYNYEDKIQEVGYPSAEGPIFRNALRTKECWAHLSCLLFNPNVTMSVSSSAVKLTDFHGLKNVLRTCSVCELKLGSVQRCSAEHCEVYFHAECARRQHYKFNYEPEESAYLQILCPSHSVESPQQNIDARVSDREKACKAFFAKVGRWLHEHESAKPEASEVSKQPFVQNKTVLSEDRHASAELVVKHLRTPDKRMLLLFRKAALKRVSLQSVIKLERVGGSADRFRYVGQRIQQTSLYEMSYGQETFPWKSFGGHQFKTKLECYERFLKIGELIRNVRANHKVYFGSGSSAPERPRRDLYEAIDESLPEESEACEFESEGMIIEQIEESNEMVQEVGLSVPAPPAEPQSAETSFFGCNPLLPSLQSLISSDCLSCNQESTNETGDSVGLFYSFWGRYTGKWASLEARAALQAEVEQRLFAAHQHVSVAAAFPTTPPKTERNLSIDSRKSDLLKLAQT